MALTLTEERRVAWKIQGVGPDPAHTLVVFKKMGTTGKTLHKILQPGEPLKLGWFESPDPYITYAISKDESLRHSFSRKYQAVGQTWTFTLHFTLDFQVTDAEALALKLEADDPLKRLEDEVAMVLSTTARHLPWELLKENPDLSFHLLDSGSAEGSGARKRNFERLTEFATQLGLGLQNIDITRSLTEEHLQADLRRNVAHQMEIESARLALELERLKQERELQGWHLQKREVMLAPRDQALQSLERLRIVLDGVTKEGIRGFSQAVDGVRSFEAVNEALLEIRAIQSSLMALSAIPSMSSDELLRAIQRLSMREVDQLLTRIVQLKAERSAPSVSPNETDLLLQINCGLSEDEADRYRGLMDKRRAGMLTPSEHQELLGLTEKAEAIQARRVRSLAELARLRGTSLGALVEELGLQPSLDV